MIYTTSNGDQFDEKKFLVKVFQKPRDILVEKDGDWKKLGYVKEADEKVNLAHCVSTSLPKSDHIWTDQDGSVYSPKNIENEVDEITKSVTTISYLQLTPDRSLTGKKFTCKINYPEDSKSYQKSILESLQIQFKPDTPRMSLESVSETESNIICSAEANPEAKFQFSLADPDGNEELFGGLSENAKISTLDLKIVKLQGLDENVQKDIHGQMSFSKVKCVAKNSRGQSELISDLKNILNPEESWFVGSYNKALSWIGSQDQIVQYGIIGGFALFLALIFLISIFICKRSRSNPRNFNHRDPESENLKNFRNDPGEYRGDYTVDKNEFYFQFNRGGSTASSRPPKESIKRRMLAHRNANDFDSGDEDDGVISPSGFSDPMSQGQDHINLQRPPTGP